MTKEDRIHKTRWNLLMQPGKGEIAACRLLQDAGFVVHRQYYVAQAFVDLALESHKLAIEIDHPRKKMNRPQRARQQRIESVGWKVLRICNSAVACVVEAVNEVLQEQETNAKQVHGHQLPGAGFRDKA